MRHETSAPPRVTLVKLGTMDQVESRAVPPLGCMYLAAVLRQQLGAECRIIDPRLTADDAPRIVERVAQAPADVVGLSAMTSEAPQLHQVARLLKARLPETPIVVGGPHATSDPDDVLSDPNVDYLVQGEGEQTLCELVEALRTRGSIDEIAGLGFHRDGIAVMNPSRPFIEDLDSMPFPAWDLIDREAYFKGKRGLWFYKSRRYMPVFTSRACPHRCIFCHKVFGKRFRARGPESVIAELRALYHTHGIREFEFYDDCVNADRSRFKEILRRFAESEMREASLQFPNGLRADTVDDETIELLRRARTFSVSIAVESATPRIQKLIRKHVKLEELRSVASKISRQGIFVHGFFMFGFPTETVAEMEETLRFALALDIDTASFFIVSPFKNTEIAEMVAREGRGLDAAPEDFDYLRPRLNVSAASDQELSAMIRRAYFEFYVSPKRAARVARALSSCPRVLLDAPKLLLDRVFLIKVGHR